MFLKYFFGLQKLRSLYLIYVRHIPIYLFKKVRFITQRKTKIVGSGKLLLGKTWRYERYLASQFIMRKNSQLILDGQFIIYSGCNIVINEGAALTLGSGYINNNATIKCYNEITIGNNVNISEGVVIRDSDNHHINGVLNQSPIVIKDNVWIGLNVTILNGVTIGEGAVIAAGSIVVSDIPAFTLAAGCPAKVKKQNVTWK